MSARAALLEPDGVTAHLVGRLTPAVLSFLLPAIQASSAQGRRQALLYIDDGVVHEQMAALPVDVHRIHVPDSDSLLLRCDALYKALLLLSRHQPLNVLHVHGLLPALAAARLLRNDANCGVEVFLSPHSSRGLGWSVAKHAVLRQIRMRPESENVLRVIVNVQRDARLLASIDRLAVQVIDCPVPRVFFEKPREEATRPLVVSCTLEHHRAAFDGFQRLAVLLNDDRLGIDFHWLGNTAARGVEGLRAAGVACFEAPTSSARATHFGSAWVYVATCDERGFPIRLAEAMASGLPCVALDTENHRSMVTPGETGYLYTNVREMLQRIGELVDSEQLRRQLGQSARREAERRFSEAEFQRRFWHALRSNSQGAAADLERDVASSTASLRHQPSADVPRCP